MESTNQNERNERKDPNQDPQQQSSTDSWRDTSQRGREEEVVNNQEQLRTTNSDRGDSTNKDSEGMRSGAEQGDYRNNDAGFRSAEERNDQEGNRRNIGTQEGDQSSEEGEESYRQGMGDNDNRNNNIPDIGREDADKTQRETPRM